MLVLTRKVDEGVLLGEDIRITVLGIDGDRVRLGVDAPKTLRIFRTELLAQTQTLNRSAAKAPFVTLNFQQTAAKKQEEAPAVEEKK